MAQKITSLTEAQKARFPEFVEKWIAIGLSTEPADKPRAEKAIRGMYALANLKAPRIVWVPCPISGVHAAMKFVHAHELAQSAPNARDAILDTVGATDPYVRRAVADALGWSEVTQDSVNTFKSVSKANAAIDQNKLKTAQNKAGNAFFGGSLWPGYPAWADYHNIVLGVELDRSYIELTMSCNYIWTLDGFCFASDRPSVINRDNAGRLHGETGQSIGYRSGWGMYHWHGTEVPAEWITDRKTLTPSLALRWGNTEQRRAACEIVGWANVLEDPSLNPRAIDENADPTIGKLVEIDLPDAPKQRFIQYRCGTGRLFAEPVTDPAYDTALKANAGGNGWRPGLGDPEDFIPVIRT